MAAPKTCPATAANVREWLGPRLDPGLPIKLISGGELVPRIVKAHYKESERAYPESYVRSYGGHVVDIREGAQQSCPCTEPKTQNRKKV